MTDKLVVTGFGREDTARLSIGPPNEEGRPAFGMGAEVFARYTTDLNAPRSAWGDKVWQVTISQGGVGGDSVESARLRAASHMLAVQLAETLDALLDENLDVTEGVVEKLLGTYPLDGRYRYTKEG